MKAIVLPSPCVQKLFAPKKSLGWQKPKWHLIYFVKKKSFWPFQREFAIIRLRFSFPPAGKELLLGGWFSQQSRRYHLQTRSCYQSILFLPHFTCEAPLKNNNTHIFSETCWQDRHSLRFFILSNCSAGVGRLVFFQASYFRRTPISEGDQFRILFKAKDWKTFALFQSSREPL